MIVDVTDAAAISSYLIAENSDVPVADDRRWSALPPSEYQIAGEAGEVALTLWLRMRDDDILAARPAITWLTVK
ncbi:MAG TPA: hypothetical protein VM186_00675 [Planctomycetota bacterium]|nr:hypothetical protein [Planctomycetota bacterium]